MNNIGYNDIHSGSVIIAKIAQLVFVQLYKFGVLLSGIINLSL